MDFITAFLLICREREEDKEMADFLKSKFPRNMKKTGIKHRELQHKYQHVTVNYGDISLLRAFKGLISHWLDYDVWDTFWIISRASDINPLTALNMTFNNVEPLATHTIQSLISAPCRCTNKMGNIQGSADLFSLHQDRPHPAEGVLWLHLFHHVGRRQNTGWCRGPEP